MFTARIFSPLRHPEVEPRDPRQKAQGDHVLAAVGAPVLLRNLVEWDGNRLGANRHALEIALGGIEVDASPLGDRVVEGIERLLIEGHQVIELGGDGLEGPVGEPHLELSEPPLDLGRKDPVGHDRVSSARGGLREQFTRGDDALTTLSADADHDTGV
jgi:hypothetical protein